MPAFLVQIDGYDPVAAAAVTLRLASVDDDRVCHLNGQTWWPAIAKLPELRYDLVDAAFNGRIDTPASQLGIAVEPFPNLPRYILSDARVQLWEGEPGLAWGSGSARFDGRGTAQPSGADGIATLPIAVDDRWLDAPLLTLYAGTTGAEGPSALKGTPKPLAIGAPRFVPGLLIDPTNLVYQLSGYGLIEDVEGAYERILAFTASAGDYANYAALVAASIPAGRWATCKAEGLVRHGAPPVSGGRFTYHVKGDKAGPDGWVRTPGPVIKRLALIGGGSGRFSEASVDALDAARPYNISRHFREQITVREAIQRIAASVNAAMGVSWLSQMFVAPLPALPGTAAVTLDASGAALPAVAKIEQLPMDPPFWRMAIETEITEDVHGLDEVAFTAQLIDTGAYLSTRTYREGNIVQDQNVAWLYINPTPASGNAPPTLPTTSNSWWKAFPPPNGAASGDQNSLNVFANGTFDLADSAGKPAGVLVMDADVGGVDAPRLTWDGGTIGGDAVIGAASKNSHGYIGRFPVKPGWKYKVKASLRSAGSATAGGLYLRAISTTTDLAPEITHLAQSSMTGLPAYAANATALHFAGDGTTTSGSGSTENGAMGTSFATRDLTFTAPANAKFGAFMIFARGDTGSVGVRLQALHIEEISGAEANADVTANHAPSLEVPGSIQIDANSGGTTTTTLPLTARCKAFEGSTNKSPDSSFSLGTLPAGISATINNTASSSDRGVITVTTANAAGNIIVNCTIPGHAEITKQIPVTRTQAAAPSGGGPGATYVTDTGFPNVTSGTLADISDIMTIRSTAGGTLIFSALIRHLPTSGNNGNVMGIKARYRTTAGPGAWNDLAAEVTGSSNDVDGESGVQLKGVVSIADTTKTGLTANTDYDVVLQGRRSSGSDTLVITGSNFTVRQTA